MTNGNLVPNLNQTAEFVPPVAPANAPRRASWGDVAKVSVGVFAIAAAGCAPDNEPRGSEKVVENNGGGGELDRVQAMVADFSHLQPPDCSPGMNGPSVAVEQTDEGLAVSGVLKNAGEFDPDTDIYLGVTTSTPKGGYRTRLAPGPGSTITIPSEEVNDMKQADGMYGYTTHFVAMPKGYELASFSKGVVVQEVVYSALKQRAGIEKPADQDAADINNILATVMSQCSNTRFDGKWVHIINTPGDYALANPRPEGVDPSQGGSEEIAPQTPTPSPDTPEATSYPEAIYFDEIEPIAQKLNQEQISMGEDGIFGYKVLPNTKIDEKTGQPIPGEKAVEISITVYMGDTGLTEADGELYQKELEGRCQDAKKIASEAGLPVNDLPVSCNGIY
jgi:hypothetical protein